jgi:putative transposase
MDNVFIERLWRSLKHEDKGYANGGEARAGIAAWMEFYNHGRLHQALGYQAPMAVWRDAMAKANAADMMANADALTTCPQSKQQTQLLAARQERLTHQLRNPLKRSRCAGPFQNILSPPTELG